MHDRVFRIAGAPLSWYQDVMAATLAGGNPVAAARTTAAALWRIDGFNQGAVEVLIPRGHDYRADVVAHESRKLPAVDLDMVEGIRVTSPTRTLIDLAATTDALVLRDAIDDAIRQGLTSVKRIEWRMRELGGRGRAGTRLLRELLNDYQPGERVPRSVFERRVIDILDAAGVRRGRRRAMVRLLDGTEVEVDVLWDVERVILEADGARWHDTRRRFARDADRRSALAAAGYRIIIARWDRLVDDPGSIVGDVIAALTWRAA